MLVAHDELVDGVSDITGAIAGGCEVEDDVDALLDGLKKCVIFRLFEDIILITPLVA